MSKTKKSRAEQKKHPPKSAVEQTRTDSELSDDQLESVAGGAVDTFAKIGDIKGESQFDAHKAEIELSSFSWGVSNRR